MNEPWTLPAPDSLPGLLVADDFRAAGLDVPHPTVVTHTDVARIILVAKGQFLTIVGKGAMGFAGGPTTIKALPIQLAKSHGYAGIVTLKHRTLTVVPASRVFSAQTISVDSFRARRYVIVADQGLINTPSCDAALI
jgi:hypothetical protein